MQTTLEKAIEVFGKENQKKQAIEELSELTTALCHDLRGRKSNVDEEIADVMIMLKQLIIIYGNADKVAQFMNQKIDRLESVLKRRS